MYLKCMLYKERDEILTQLVDFKGGWRNFPDIKNSGVVLIELEKNGCVERHSDLYSITDHGELAIYEINMYKERNKNDSIAQTLESFLIKILEIENPLDIRSIYDVFGEDINLYQNVDNALIELYQNFPNLFEQFEKRGALGTRVEKVVIIRIKRRMLDLSRHIQGGMCWAEACDTTSEQPNYSHVEQYMSGDQYNITGNNLTNSQVSAGVDHSNTMNVNAEKPLKNEVERYFDVIKQLMLEIQSISKENLEHELGNQELLVNLYKEMTNLDGTIKDAIIDEKIKLSDLVDMIEPIWEKEMKELTKSQWVKLSEKTGNAIFSKVVGRLVP